MEDEKQLSPVMSALMCDGMGWFSSLDYKRALLVYDKIFYLLPKNLVSFTDVSGKQQVFFYPISVREEPAYEVCNYLPDPNYHELIFEAADIDLRSDRSASILDTIPKHEQIYTWRVVNADGDLGKGKSLALEPGDSGLAYSLLLNKFLVAASVLDLVPITGKQYVHKLISEKYRLAVERLVETRPQLIHPTLKSGVIGHNPVLSSVVSAIVPDSELVKRSDHDIIRFKEKNRLLFERFSYSTRILVASIESYPFSPEFDRDIIDLINTEVWKEKSEIENELHSSWESFFSTAVKSAVTGLVSVGITPFLSLGAITLASVIGASAAIAPWAISELIDLITNQKEAQKNGLYYLMKFAK